MFNLKIKLSLTQIARLQIIVLSALIFVLVLISTVFLYKNVYKTLESIKEVSALRDQIVVEKISTDLSKQVIQSIESKKTAPNVDWTALKNPFLPYATDNSESTN